MPHIHELYDFTTSAFIVRRDKVLLLHHKKIGKWLQPGGHIELDEDPLEALLREILEETGLKQGDFSIIEPVDSHPSSVDQIKQIPVPFDINVHDFDDTHHHIDLCYLAVAHTDRIKLEEGKAHDIRWLSRDDLEQLVASNSIFTHTYQYALFALSHPRIISTQI